MPKVNLLELCLSPSLGGLELYMMHTAKVLNDEFNVTTVVASGSKLEPYFKDTQYEYIGIKRKRGGSFLAAIRLAKIIDENSIDIVHLHWTKDLPTTVMAKFFAKKKFKIVQSRHMHMTRFKNDIYHRYLYKQMELILPVTNQVAEQIEKFIPEEVRPKVEMLYIGSEQVNMLNEEEVIRYKKEIKASENEFIIGMIGRIEEKKRQYLLIEAIEKLKLEGIDLKLYFVGHAMEESYQKTLEDKIVDKGLESSVYFLGFSNKVHRFIQTCDCIVLATPCETFGLVLIEAMQMGTAVIATNACGPLEIIDDGKTGLLFEKDSVEDLVSKVKILHNDSALKKTLSLAGKKKAEDKFSSSIQYKKLIDLLNSL